MDRGAMPFEKVSQRYLDFVMRSPLLRMETGYKVLDEVLRLFPGMVMVLMARPAVGKTAWACNVISRMRKHQTIFFSLEMPAIQVWERIAQIDLNMQQWELEDRIRHGDAGLLVEVATRYPNLYIMDKNAMTVQDMINVINRHEGPVDMVVVDYLQYVRAPGASGYERTTAAIRDMKRLAKECNVLVVVLSQLSREGGNGGQPVSSNMARDSGAVEETADYLLGAWRPELDPGCKWDQKDLLKVAVLKNRFGPLALYGFHWDGPTQTVKEVADIVRETERTDNEAQAPGKQDGADSDEPGNVRTMRLLDDDGDDTEGTRHDTPGVDVTDKGRSGEIEQDVDRPA